MSRPNVRPLFYLLLAIIVTVGQFGDTATRAHQDAEQDRSVSRKKGFHEDQLQDLYANGGVSPEPDELEFTDLIGRGLIFNKIVGNKAATKCLLELKHHLIHHFKVLPDSCLKLSAFASCLPNGLEPEWETTLKPTLKPTSEPTLEPTLKPLSGTTSSEKSTDGWP